MASAFGAYATPTSPSTNPPVAPTIFSVTTAYGQISLTWSGGTATNYTVKRSTTSGAEMNLATTTSTTYTDTSVVNGTTYYYEVSAANAYGTSSNSAEVSATPPVPPPAGTVLVDFNSAGATPAGSTSGVYWNDAVITSGGGGAVVLNGSAAPMALVNTTDGTPGWTLAITNLTGWNSGGASTWLYYNGPYPAAVSGFPATALSEYLAINDASSPGPAVSVTLSGLATNSTYNLLTYGAGASGSGAISGPQTNTLTVGSSASPPTVGFNALGNSTTLVVWTNITPSAAGKIVFTIDGPNGAALNLMEVSPASTTPSTNPPATPTGLGATPGNRQVALTWTASSGATSYNVKRSTSSGAETTITNVTGVNYTDTQVVNGTTYYYKVSATNTYGESANSLEVSATPQAQAPPTPTGLGAAAGNGQEVLTWTASTGATSYNVKRSTTSGAETTLTNVTAVNYTDTQVVNGTTYYYMVSATNASGESVNSGEVSATPQAQQQEVPGTTALINFEADKAVPNPTSGLYWNNIGVGYYQDDSSSTLSKISENGGTSATSVGLVDTGNVNDGWSLSISNCANGAVHGNGNEMAGSVFNSSQTAIWPVMAMEDGIQINSSAAGPDVSIYISGLKSNDTYDVLFYAGDNNNSYTQTNMLVNCGNASPVSFAYNIKQTTNYCSWSNVSPTNGVMILTLSLPGNGDWGAMNCMELIQNMPAAIGGIARGAMVGNSLTLNWTANANVHLQSATNLAPPVVWTDVPNTTGQGSAAITTTNTHMYFRLIQP